MSSVCRTSGNTHVEKSLANIAVCRKSLMISLTKSSVGVVTSWKHFELPSHYQWKPYDDIRMFVTL